MVCIVERAERVGERVRDEILEIPFITQAELALVRRPEVSIEVSEAAQRRSEGAATAAAIGMMR